MGLLYSKAVSQKNHKLLLESFFGKTFILKKRKSDITKTKKSLFQVNLLFLSAHFMLIEVSKGQILKDERNFLKLCVRCKNIKS